MLTEKLTAVQSQIDQIVNPKKIISIQQIMEEARNFIYRIYGGEDIALSLNSYKLCNVTSKIFKMQLIEKQFDGNNQRADKQIISQYENEKTPNFNLFKNCYCYLIRSGYIPRRWADFHVPEKDFFNIM